MSLAAQAEHVRDTRRGLIQSIHDYQRQGGLTRQFEQLDRAVTDYLVAGPFEAVPHEAHETETETEVQDEAVTRRPSRAGESHSRQQSLNGGAVAEQ